MTAQIHSTPAQLAGLYPRIAVAMGVFDGVHLGHQKIMQQLVALAERTGAAPVALFFSPHPKAVVHPPAPLHLTCEAAKVERLQLHGAKALVRLPFTQEMAALSPTDFLERFFLHAGIKVTGFCVGDNWRFGCKNQGDGNLLAQWAQKHAMETQLVPQQLWNNEIISSTRIREAVANGNLTSASAMLGRPFEVYGIIKEGNKVGGTKLNCPTANIIDPGHAMPPHGVYAARAHFDGNAAEGIAYIGNAPSIRGKDFAETWLELHLFDFNANLYGKYLRIELPGFIRPSLVFNSPEELKSQILKDIEACKTILASLTQKQQLT